jgi:hypothetical protein
MCQVLHQYNTLDIRNVITYHLIEILKPRCTILSEVVDLILLLIVNTILWHVSPCGFVYRKYISEQPTP